MKKSIYTLVFLCIASFAIAQETNEKEFKLPLGDTMVWMPFDNCDTINYKIKEPQAIDFKIIKSGDRIQVIAKKLGTSRIIATCSDNDITTVAKIVVYDPNEIIERAKKPEKPETQKFTSTYKFIPPKDHFFVTIKNEETQFNETYMKLGNDEAFNDGQGIDRFWNIKTGKNWYYRPDAQGWTDDVDWEFEPLGESFDPLNSFANEVNKDNLSNYYVGMEKVANINCWRFFVEQSADTVIQYWVDPANGCTLKRQINNHPAKVVTVYDLKYTRLYFGPKFKKGLHDTTR